MGKERRKKSPHGKLPVGHLQGAGTGGLVFPFFPAPSLSVPLCFQAVQDGLLFSLT